MHGPKLAQPCCLGCCHLLRRIVGVGTDRCHHVTPRLRMSWLPAVLHVSAGDVAAELDCYGPSGEAASVKMIMTLIAATPTTHRRRGQTDAPEKAAFEAKYHLDQREQRPGESREEFADRAGRPVGRTSERSCSTSWRTSAPRWRGVAPPSTQPTPTKPVPAVGGRAS